MEKWERQIAELQMRLKIFERNHLQLERNHRDMLRRYETALAFLSENYETFFQTIFYYTFYI